MTCGVVLFVSLMFVLVFFTIKFLPKARWNGLCHQNSLIASWLLCIYPTPILYELEEEWLCYMNWALVQVVSRAKVARLTIMKEANVVMNKNRKDYDI
jgi:hypothetical protein